MTVQTRRAPYAGWRALAATVLVMSGAVGAHTWAGGHLPRWPGLVLLAAVLLGSSRVLLGGTGSWKLLLPFVLAAQAALHTSFLTLGATSGHEQHAAHATTAAGSPWSGRMLLAHGFVALLTLLVWRLCERAAVVVVRLLSYAAAPLGRIATARPRPTHDLPGGWSVLLLCAPRRGPPLVAGHR